MYISRVRLEDIRGFPGRRNVDLTLTRPDGSHAGWTVLAGRNGSGKTSLLRAIALAVGGPAVVPSMVPDFRPRMTKGAPISTAELWLNSGNLDIPILLASPSNQTVPLLAYNQFNDGSLSQARHADTFLTTGRSRRRTRVPGQARDSHSKAP